MCIRDRSIFGGGDAKTVNTVQNADPWSGVQPYLKDVFSRSNYLANRGWNPAPAVGGGSIYSEFGSGGFGSGGVAGILGGLNPSQQSGPPQIQQQASFNDVDAILAKQSPY